jgi:hypothetical protein
MIKIAVLLLAVLISIGITPGLTLAAAQNATTTTNTTTTETNATIPLEPTQLPVFPEGENVTTAGNETSSNQTEAAPETKDNATQADDLLDEAQIKIDEARQLIASLRAQLEQAGRPIAGNETGQIIQDANESAIDIGAVVNNSLPNNPEIVQDVENITQDIEDAIEDSIESNENATGQDIENVTDDAVEAIENATDATDNSTTEVALDNGMIRLLSNLVAAQDYNLNLAQEDRDELKANLQDAIVELASDAADSLR